MEDTSIAPADGTCYFLRLPAELRNLIYRQALFSPEGLACRSTQECGKLHYRLYAIESYDDSSKMNGYTKEPLGIATSELNQLKFVCRQLNVETKCVSTSINAIVFLKGIPDFCPKSVLNQISSPRTSLLDFCKQQPYTSVKLRHSWLDPHEPDFFQRMIEFAIHFRNDRGVVARVTASLNAQQYLIHRAVDIWYADMEISDRLKEYPQNLRAFPPYKTLNDVVFKDHYLADAIVMLDVNMSDGLPGGVELVKGVFQLGI
ncbi:hypothetical protein HBH70_201270 [Parastagonospora nodorum]|nr:hypothetical protein HBH52_010390 [Parastagonospora nodorum]KAH4059732.1 hypothetical protein HBH49_022120 [Parastagonospora nodorum]KAH4075181.1 hypothetical protein HBH50_034980 [Parastagonospora nodorum]KAH4097239.1 hypothetical protein HBH48_043840 [Parastagonospora nodorum]KAH4204119.1 hypothetical protein HBH42_010140 [Parastagonospora nodorum]